jgi:hypothetical protein
VSDQPAHSVTLHLLEKLGGILPAERREVVLAHRNRIESLLAVDDDESARETARTLLQDALSV